MGNEALEIVFQCKHGSHAYGTNIEGSDIDIRNICMLPVEYILGLKTFRSTQTKGEYDIATYDLRKFVQLASNSNPNIFEILFVDESDIIKMDDIIKPLFEARNLFLSKRVRYSFFGYAESQLQRILSHRKWILNPPTKLPERKDFGLPERSTIPKEEMELINSQIRKFLDSFELNLQDYDDSERIEINNSVKNPLVKAGLNAEGIIETISNAGIMKDELIDNFNKERAYKNAKKEWDQYQVYLKNRNPARLALEKKCGYDSKNGGHLLRLGRMGIEILDGVVNVKRPDKDYLIKVRMGEVPFDVLMDEVEKLKATIDKKYNESKLPKKPDLENIEKIVIQILERYLSGKTNR